MQPGVQDRERIWLNGKSLCDNRKCQRENRCRRKRRFIDAAGKDKPAGHEPNAAGGAALRRYLLMAVVLSMGCASTGFHEGKTTLGKSERGYLVAGKAAQEGPFDRFWRGPNLRPWGLVKWQEDRSWATSDAPKDLLQSIRDELGRLNQRAGNGENVALAVTVYRFEKSGMWKKPTAYYELVARDERGKVVWAADDKVRASEDLALSLVEPPSSTIAREILRKVREQFGI